MEYENKNKSDRKDVNGSSDFFNQGKMKACGANGSLAALMVRFPTLLLAERK
jgi:hypothetical protein